MEICKAETDTSSEETCEADWAEHEEFSSKKISVLRGGSSVEAFKF
ncbi:MAG: hypothetical protein KGJ35_02655 [Patescibacteria group bacterium]|nr:hypothetical protein [Patescibacteria group bacterium]